MTESAKKRELESIVDEGEGDSGGGWLTTFSDLCLLLLAFFVLLYAMSELNTKRFQSYILSVRQALGTFKGGQMAMKTSSQASDGVFLKQAKMLKQMEEMQSKVFADFNFYYNRKGMEGVVGGKFDNGKIIVRVDGDVLFDSGEVRLSSRGKEVVGKLKGFFIEHSNQTINIKGHTDNRPPSPQSRFEDNWEISALRAIHVLRYLVEQGIKPSRMTATGLADLQPIVPNDSPANRAQNRRVEFVLEREIRDGGA
jgi:chemotaxis protein MotB